MNIQENVNLAPYTTFKIGGPAKYFCVVKTAKEAAEALNFAKEKNIPYFILGNGSNLLVSDKGFKGLVLKIENSGIELQKEEGGQVFIRANAGENWDKVVEFAVSKNLWGIENLSHIPGSVGALAVQNVGAYGQEISQVLSEVEVLDTNTLQTQIFLSKELNFGYRSSIFNTSHKNKYIIFSILLKLSKNPKPNLEYRDLKNAFEAESPLLSDIRNKIIEIRNKKYPFPTEAKNGNAGSFFKNISMPPSELEKFLTVVENKFGIETKENIKLKLFIKDNENIKIPTAALIELLGMKNSSLGGAQINENQPLVILNKTGSATAKDVLDLANLVIEKIYNTFGFKVEIEPNLLGF